MTFIIQASQAFKHSTHVNTSFPERRMFYQMSKALSIQIAAPSTTTTCQSERNGKEKGLCAVTHPVAEFGVPAAHLLEEREPGAQEPLPRLPSPPAWLWLHSMGRWPLRSHPCPRLLLLHSWSLQILLPSLCRGEDILFLLAASLSVSAYLSPGMCGVCVYLPSPPVSAPGPAGHFCPGSLRPSFWHTSTIILKLKQLNQSSHLTTGLVVSTPF